LHNEQLCEELLRGGKYPDWVVTTAFYSALHFVKHQIFPLNHRGKNFKTFEDYYSREERAGVDKHTSLANLVCKNLKGCKGAYRWLLDSSKNSRYNNYQVSPQKANQAQTMLGIVKSHCTKP